jgi:ribonuclease BN (tRNA processing enzyme)
MYTALSDQKPTVDAPLSLTNSGELEVFFIGVGSAFSMTHYQLNVLLIKGDHHVLVDYGMTGPIALKETAQLHSNDIEVILPTHSHADHIGGIECLALMNRYVGQRIFGRPKLKMIVDEHYQNILWTHSLQGGLEWNEVDINTAQQLTFDDYFDVIRPTPIADMPRQTFEVTVGDLKLEIFRTNHIPEQAKDWSDSFTSYGLFIDDRVFLSMDTQFDRELIGQYAERSEVMFHDVQFFSGAVHAPLADLRTLPDEIKQKMLFIHYADDWEKHDISDFAGWAEQGVRYVFH